MAEKKDNRNIRMKSWVQFIVTVTAIILLVSAFNSIRLRVDLTEDRRYTLSEPTLAVLDGIKDDIYIQVYLDGEMPVPLKRLRRSVGEMLEEFRIVSGKQIDYEFINPADSRDARQRDAQYSELYNKGLNPVNIQAGDEEGGSLQKMIFPGMIVNYNGIEVPVNFLKNNQSVSYEQNILHSMESLEYEMIQTIAAITSDTIYKVAFLEGHEELPEVEVADLTINLAKYFTVDRGTIGGKAGILDNYSAVIVAGPEKEFSESDKLVLDQYIMNGGRVIWLFEEVAVSADSLVQGESVGLYHPLNLEDQLFRYGARVNPELVQDLECMVVPLSVTTGAEQKQIVPAPFVYYPLLSPNQNHPVTRNINKVRGLFVNSIDTVGLDPAIKKTILLSTSALSRTLTPPLLISMREASQVPDEKYFNRPGLPVAVLLEGTFPSAFKNRMTGKLISDRNFRLKTESSETKMIVISDGDIIRNDVRRSGTTATPYPLGLDRYSGQMFGNRDFLINCMNYLVDDNGLMELRSREMKLRLLNKPKIRTEKTKWQLVNIGLPVLLVILAGMIYGFFRKRKYTKIVNE
ncbi:MAG: gliding motility-associated ABC transporter substrate-binding protein GldG [Bacteroidales bacterium]|jgi:ABC-2 type transport system permease protein|nr:gliding motility-associated ABC transporter substrate-binding protein GldG [Bacteroidales bacterium]